MSGTKSGARNGESESVESRDALNYPLVCLFIDVAISDLLTMFGHL